MRKERALQQSQEELVVTLRQRDEELQLRERILQLSLSINRTSRDLKPVMHIGIDVRNFLNFGELRYNLKPDTFDNSAPLQQLLAQFELILLANK